MFRSARLLRIVTATFISDTRWMEDRKPTVDPPCPPGWGAVRLKEEPKSVRMRIHLKTIGQASIPPRITATRTLVYLTTQRLSITRQLQPCAYHYHEAVDCKEKQSHDDQHYRLPTHYFCSACDSADFSSMPKRAPPRLTIPYKNDVYQYNSFDR